MKLLFKNIRSCYRIACAKQLHYLFLVCLQLFSCVLFAQKRALKFEYIGIEAGLSANNVSCVLQDSRGFMWFGTTGGLNKYDGYQFTIYKNNNADPYSLGSNSIASMIEDAEKVMWIGTWGGGLNKFDRQTNRFIHYKHDPRDKNSISSNFITSLLEDKQGNLWIGTENGGLDILDRATNQFIHYSHGNANKTLGYNFVTTIFEDSRNNLWVGTFNGGLSLLDRNSHTFKTYKHNENDNKSLCNDIVNIVFEDSRKNLWIGTNDRGLDQLNVRTGEFSHFGNRLSTNAVFGNYDLLSIIEDGSQNLLIGSRNGGFSIFNPLTGAFQNYHHDELDITSLSQNTVGKIYRDPKGNIWLGTMGGGINFLNSGSNRFLHYKHTSATNSLSDNLVTSMYEDADQNLWIGTDGGGLNLFDRKSGMFTHYMYEANNKNSLGSNNVLGICGDSRGNLWIATWGMGVTVFNRKKNTFKHFKNDPANSSSLSGNNVWTVYEDKEKNIWIGTYGEGLNLYNPETDSFIHYKYDENNPSGINNNQVIAIFEDSRGLLWVGTDGGGLNQFNRKTNTFIHFIHDSSRNSLSYNYVSDILEDREGNLYFATGTGLDYLNMTTHHFTNYIAKDGFTDDAANRLLQDEKGNLWISTATGISFFNPSTKQFKNFGTEDGLHPNNYRGLAGCKSITGAMYFGGVNGFDEFYPRNVKKISYDPPLLITDFKIFNKPVPVAVDANDPSPLKKDITETRQITIPYSSSVISFEFASLHYGVKERKQYAYMLEGFDNTWNEVGTKHTATYTNLDPATYVFKVKGLNNDGSWSSNITSIQLIIEPPFWLTWWFRLLLILTVTGSVFTFYRVRINRVKRQRSILEQKVKEKTIQLVYSNEEERKARLEAGHANDELAKKNQELEQFVYIASHDLQEPLRTTTSFVELFQKQYKGKLDTKADSYLLYIIQASDRMKTLINDLLDYSRIGTKRELERVDCNMLLQEVLTDLGTAIQEAHATISAERLPVIMAYTTGIKQLFQNLIANGIKFRKKDIAPQIKISIQDSKTHWQFTIADNGIGIEQKDHEKIFMIFQRLHTRNEYKGSGIGLAHSKKIVELHGGNIWVESKGGEGTTVHFTILKADS